MYLIMSLEEDVFKLEVSSENSVDQGEDIWERFIVIEVNFKYFSLFGVDNSEFLGVNFDLQILRSY